jgi:hypothetical protein
LYHAIPPAVTATIGEHDQARDDGATHPVGTVGGAPAGGEELRHVGGQGWVTGGVGGPPLDGVLDLGEPGAAVTERRVAVVRPPARGVVGELAVQGLVDRVAVEPLPQP